MEACKYWPGLGGSFCGRGAGLGSLLFCKHNGEKYLHISNLTRGKIGVCCATADSQVSAASPTFK